MFRINNELEEKVTMLPMNLQLFATGNDDADDEEMDTNDDENFDDDFENDFDDDDSENDEDGEVVDTKEDDEEEESEDTGESEEDVEVAEPQTQKQNKAFAELRRGKEAAEKKLAELDTWAKNNFADKGINSFSDYQAAMNQQLQQQKEQEWIDKGYDPSVIREILKQDPDYQAAINQGKMIEQQRQQEADNQKLKQEYEQLCNEYPDFIKNPEDIDAETWKLREKGYSLSDAFLVSHKSEIMGKTKAATKQRTLNNINSKSHIKGDKGSNSVDDISVPKDVVESYKAMFPGIKMSAIKKDYKSFLKQNS